MAPTPMIFLTIPSTLCFDPFFLNQPAFARYRVTHRIFVPFQISLGVRSERNVSLSHSIAKTQFLNSRPSFISTKHPAFILLTLT